MSDYLRAFVVVFGDHAALVYARSHSRARWLVWREYGSEDFGDFIRGAHCHLASWPPSELPAEEGIETEDERLQQRNGVCFAESLSHGAVFACACPACEMERLRLSAGETGAA